jgi:hypothetical protein
VTAKNIIQLGLIYEHWRLDKNECFYVGQAKGKNPYERARSLSRNNTRYQRIVRKLKDIGLIEIRTAEFHNISRSELNNLEKLTIAHWKMYIGNRLTNVTPGGDGGPIMRGKDNPMSDPKVKARHLANVPRGESHYGYHNDRISARVRGDLNPAKQPGARIKNSEAQIRLGRWKDNNNPSCNPQHRDLWYKSLCRGDENIFSKLHKQGLLAGENHYFIKFPEKKESTIIAIKESKQLPHVKEAYRQMGIRKRERGSCKGSKNNMFGKGYKLAGAKNGRAKITEIVAQSILDAQGSIAALARQFEVSRDIVGAIKRRETWTHLTPSTNQ